MRALRVTFLYIGAIIGAGFASGREIAVFFGDTAPAWVALSALFMGLLAALFMTAGKTGALPAGTAVETGVTVASFSSAAAMIAGSEYVLRAAAGVPLFGAVAAIAAGAVVSRGIERIKTVSTLLIPLLVVLLVAVYLKNGAPVFGGEFSVVKPMHYAGLDVLLGGMMISREGKDLSAKQIAAVSLLSAAVFGLLLFMLQNIVLSDDMNSSMPVLAVADRVGLSAVATVLIIIAIFTTLVSSLDLLTQRACSAAARASAKTGPARGGRVAALAMRAAAFASESDGRTTVAFGLLCLLYPVSFFGFETIVDTLYPFIGLCGIAMTLWTAARLALFGIKKAALARRPTQGELTRPRGRDRSRTRPRGRGIRSRIRHLRPRSTPPLPRSRGGGCPRRGNGGTRGRARPAL